LPERPLIDISRTISETTAVWPGDSPFSRRWIMSIATGCSCNTSTITLSAHCGTHSDAPCHFVDGAKGIAEVDLGLYLGRCRVVHAKHLDCVRLSDIEGLDLRREERLLFRTPRPLKDDEWRDDFPYLSLGLARRAAAEGLKLIGIDTPSVDPMTSKTLEAHKALLQGGVAILESLDLGRVSEGLYELIALPLRIVGGDSSPVRAVLRSLG
jgi:arylformamidase